MTTRHHQIGTVGYLQPRYAGDYRLPINPGLPEITGFAPGRRGATRTRSVIAASLNLCSTPTAHVGERRLAGARQRRAEVVKERYAECTAVPQEGGARSWEGPSGLAMALTQSQRDHGEGTHARINDWVNGTDRHRRTVGRRSEPAAATRHQGNINLVSISDSGALDNGPSQGSAISADIEHLGIERGHRTLVITRKGGKVVTIPLAPRTARAIDLAIGERTEGPMFLAADGAGWTATAPGGSSGAPPAAPGSPSPSGRTRCATRSSPPHWTPGSRCGTCRKPPPTLTRAPPCAMTGPAPPWTGMPPTSSPPTSPEPPGSHSRRPGTHPPGWPPPGGPHWKTPSVT